MEHYDAILNFIRAYNIVHEEDLFKHAIEKNVFIALADSVCEIVDNENSNSTNIDYNRVVENTWKMMQYLYSKGFNYEAARDAIEQYLSDMDNE